MVKENLNPNLVLEEVLRMCLCPYIEKHLQEAVK